VEFDKLDLVKRMVEALSTDKLCALLEECEQVDMPAENTAVRGWLFKELERRNPAAFAAWQAGPGSLGPSTYFK